MIQTLSNNYWYSSFINKLTICWTILLITSNQPKFIKFWRNIPSKFYINNRSRNKSNSALPDALFNFYFFFNSFNINQISSILSFSIKLLLHFHSCNTGIHWHQSLFIIIPKIASLSICNKIRPQIILDLDSLHCPWTILNNLSSQTFQPVSNFPILIWISKLCILQFIINLHIAQRSKINPRKIMRKYTPFKHPTPQIITQDLILTTNKLQIHHEIRKVQHIIVSPKINTKHSPHPLHSIIHWHSHANLPH